MTDEMQPGHHYGHTAAPVDAKNGDYLRAPSILEREAKLRDQKYRPGDKLFNAQAPNRPSLYGAQWYQLKMRRTSARAASDVSIAVPNIWSLVALRAQAGLRRFLAFHLFLT